MSLHKANTECNLKREELEKTNIRLEHSNTELNTTRDQLSNLESIIDENLSLKKSLMNLETEKKVI